MKTFTDASVAEISISYRNQVPFSEMKKITNSRDAFLLLTQVWAESLSYRESFYILMLNKANRVLGFSMISIGGISGTVVDPKIIFQSALKANATSLILAHNHPSGNLQPSEADIKLTKKITSGGLLLDIAVLDHLIITSDDQYYSFADDGKM